MSTRMPTLIWCFTCILSNVGGAVFAQNLPPDRTPSDLLNYPPPPGELQLVMEKYKTTTTGHDLSEGKVLRRAFGEVLGHASLDTSGISQDDQSQMQTALLSSAEQNKRSDATMDQVCELIADDSTDIHTIASLAMRADEEADADLTEHYLAAYQRLSSDASRLVDQAAVSYRNNMRSTTTDLAGLSLERPIEVHGLLTDGCEERRKRAGTRAGSNGLAIDVKKGSCQKGVKS